MNQAIRVSKIGVDVLGTAVNDPNNLLVDTTLNTFKIVVSGTALGTVSSSSTGVIAIPHGLSYTPLPNAFIKRTDGTIVIGSSGSVPFPIGSFSLRSVSSDATNIYATIRNDNFSTGTFSIRYFGYEVPLV